MSYSVYLPNYSIGEDCYKELPYVARNYGKKVVVIGGKTAKQVIINLLIFINRMYQLTFKKPMNYSLYIFNAHPPPCAILTVSLRDAGMSVTVFW